MRGFNQATVAGHLGQDPEIRYSASGNAVCNMLVATKDRYKNEDRTEWHRIITFGKLAELCGQYLKKGSPVLFQGKIQTRSYEKDGQTRYITEIIADRMEMLGKSEVTEQPKDYADKDELPF
jgi:single-strand DNA-binding protein